MAFNLGSMMSMFTPTIKSKDVIINKLKAAKTIEAGDMSGIMDKVMSGGLQQMLQNPSGGSGGKAKQNAQQGAQQAATQMQGGSPAGYNNPVTQAFNGLADDIDALLLQAAYLVGLGTDDQGLLQSLGISQIADNFPEDSPYHISVMLKPANAEDELLDVAAQCLIIADAFINRLIGQDDALFRINLMRAEISAITTKSQTAVTALTAAVVKLQSALASNALLQGGLPEWKDVMERAIRQDVRPTLDLGNSSFLGTN
jgi:hypothetical protein